MNLLDALNDVDSRQIDLADVPMKDGAVHLSAVMEAIHTSEAGVEAAASQATSSLTPALARYIDDLGLDQGIDLMAEAQRFELGIIERALELSKGNQKRAAELLGLHPSTLHAKIKKYGMNASRRKNARR